LLRGMGSRGVGYVNVLCKKCRRCEGVERRMGVGSRGIRTGCLMKKIKMGVL
jgi:hypothetical protein